MKVCHFPDHHNFSRDDLESIRTKFDSLSGERKIILTTEKDAVRLAYNPYFPTRLKQICYFIPIAVKWSMDSTARIFITDLKKSIDSISD